MQKQFNITNQNGAVLLVLEIVAVVLILFAALAIDSTLIATSRTEERRQAEFVALGALQTYGKSSNLTPPNRLLAAKGRAEEIANVHIKLSLTESFRKDSSYTEDIGDNTSGPSGRIVPGIWHFRPELDQDTGVCLGASPCPCSSGKWVGPCLEELDFSAMDFNNQLNLDKANQVNAFKAELNLREESPLRTIFGKFTNIEEVVVTAKAVSSVVPSRVVFLLDLSRSVHMETHLPYELVAGIVNPSEYAFKLRGPLTCGDMTVTGKCPALTPAQIPDCPAPNTAISAIARLSFPPTSCAFDGGFIPDGTYNTNQIGSLYTALFNNYCGQPIFPKDKIALNHEFWKHAKNDYQCVTVSYSKGTEPSVTEHYLVDYYRGQTKDLNPYKGPEPLNTMMSAISYTIERLQARNVSGDMIGAIGFDDRADIDIRTFDLDSPFGTSSTDLYQVTHIDNANYNNTTLLQKRHQTHMFFPRVDAMLNIPDALNQAVEMLKNTPGYQSAENHVVLITDGITNCSGGGGGCEKSEEVVKASIDESIALVNSTFVPNNIRLSVFLIGQVSGPHTLLRRGARTNTSDSCMDENEAKDSSLSLVNSCLSGGVCNEPSALATTFDSNNIVVSTNGKISINRPFYYPNQLFQATSASDGIWAAVREPCTPGAALLNGKTCQNGGLVETLNNKCKANSIALGALVPNDGTLNNIVDSDARLRCDPSCRDRSTQIRGYIDEVLRRSPYVIVE